MPGDERDDVGSPNDGRGQAKPPVYLGIGIDKARCAACAAFPSVPCAFHREEP